MVNAQSTSPSHRAPCQFAVNTFPYTQSFETSEGGWFSGGQNNDWAYGTPAKTVINSAGDGTKCWVVGGLTGSAYRGSEYSWVQSPCFDLSSLTNPEISFKIFWESERRFDGAGFEYSTDGGTSWNVLGSGNSNSNCDGTNWFNTPSISYLLSQSGWSGNIQPNAGSCQGGGGSNGWLTARHTLKSLTGEKNVSFRFLFGSGTTCNAFEGFAFDAIRIGEAPPNNAEFSYTCGSNKSVSFQQTANCTKSAAWNFGDPSSGANNTSSLTNPTHVFSSAGTYTVTFTATFNTGAPVTLSKTITVLDANISIINQLKCFGESTGSMNVTATGSTNVYTYTWNTSPVKYSALITDLSAGTYTVTIGSANSCNTTASITLTEPAELKSTNTIAPSICTANNGSVHTLVTGGIAPYQYIWSNGTSADFIDHLAPGNYSLVLKDANGCTTGNQFEIKQENQNIPIHIGNDTVICPGEKLILAPGNFTKYLWQDNSTSSTFTVTETGTYSVKVFNNLGCEGTATIKVVVDCSDIYFPSAFSPNGDGRNDMFGPGGNVAGVQSYSLTIYDRFGGRAFYSTSPYQKWNGTIKGGTYNTGSFVWMAKYIINGKTYNKKGTILILR